MRHLNVRLGLLCLALCGVSVRALAQNAGGSLQVTSYPSGAHVSIDGADTGKITPMSASLTLGQHTVVVTVSNSGWNPDTRTVNIVSGNNDLSVTLLPVLTVGPSGPQGQTGPQGPAGPQGLVGPTGPAGAEGPAGPAGPPGIKGDDGATGSQGAKGDAGPVGPAGSQGPQGSPGPQGPIGPQGPPGAEGSQGAQGPAGIALPFFAFDPSQTHAIRISKTGVGAVAWFSNDNVNNANPVLVAQSSAPSGSAAATFQSVNPATVGPTLASQNLGKGNSAWFWNVSSNPSATLAVGRDGPGPAAKFVGDVDITGALTINGQPAGLQGPQGLPGPAGPQGPTGAQGPVGPSGLMYAATTSNEAGMALVIPATNYSVATMTPLPAGVYLVSAKAVAYGSSAGLVQCSLENGDSPGAHFDVAAVRSTSTAGTWVSTLSLMGYFVSQPDNAQTQTPAQQTISLWCLADSATLGVQNIQMHAIQVNQLQVF